MLAAQTGWTNDQVGIALLVPYLAGGVLSWFLVSESHSLGFPPLVAGLAVAGAMAVLVVTLVGAWSTCASCESRSTRLSPPPLPHPDHLSAVTGRPDRGELA